MSTTNYWVYILLCNNGCYYTGYTIDFVRRYREHLKGTPKCKYTRSFKPIDVAQCWQLSGSKSVAMKAERIIKKMSKKEKELLILFPEKLLEQLPYESLRPINFKLLLQNR